MWDLPGQGIEPMSPALAGRFLTTAPPGKFRDQDLNEGTCSMTTMIKGDSSVIPKLSQGPKQKTKEARLSFINCLWISVNYDIPSHDQHGFSPVAAAIQCQELLGIYW